MFKDLSKTEHSSALDRLFLSILLPPRGGIFGTYTLAERLFLCLSGPPRGGIFGKHDLSRVWTLSPLRLSPDRLFLSESVPPRGGIFAPRGVRAVTKMAARAVFFCPFEKPLAQFAFSKKKNFPVKKISKSENPPARRDRCSLRPYLRASITSRIVIRWSRNFPHR